MELESTACLEFGLCRVAQGLASLEASDYLEALAVDFVEVLAAFEAVVGLEGP